MATTFTTPATTADFLAANPLAISHYWHGWLRFIAQAHCFRPNPASQYGSPNRERSFLRSCEEMAGRGWLSRSEGGYFYMTAEGHHWLANGAVYIEE